ncbi:MAG: Ldh family oxidoreductase [Betaproteobacteria bacterium]|nr:Ldh family oxidoreductase [Betaproteobacteria bacterium]
MLHCPPNRLQKLAAAILVGAGAAEEEAASVAHYLVRSDLVGHASHGVLRVKQYVEQIGKGQIVCRKQPAVVNEGPGFAVLEGHLGFGQIGAAIATKLACEKAVTQGIAMVALRNSAHVGRLGDWVELAAELGCASFHFVNTLAAPTVAPWGGKERRLSTNPLAWGMPVENGEPIIVDLTTSVVAEGKVRLARAAGKKIPPGWIVDRDGQSSTDPNDLYTGGALLPLGGLDAGHKGYALSLMVDLMAGAISGGGTSGAGRKINCNNFTIIAIDTQRVAGGAIEHEAALFTDWIKSATPAETSRPVLLPGDVERATQSRHRRDGIPLDEGVLAALREAAIAAGLSADIVNQTLELTVTS